MKLLGWSTTGRRPGTRVLGVLAAVAVAGAATAAGCGGDDTETSSGSGTTTSASTTGPGSGGSGGTGGGTTSTTTTTATGTGGAGGAGGSGGTGGGPGCVATQPGPTRGSAIALTPDDARLVTVNRDAGTVTVMAVDYSDGQPAMTVVSELAVGGEPWQVAIDACGQTAFVVLRKDQKVVRIDQLDGTPVVGPSADVGSEPTGLALTPNGTSLYVSNWVEGTLSIVDPASMAVTGTVDLNATLAATGALGTVSPRPALAHPRALAITNDGDADDTDETVYATEWFAARTGPESAVGTESDTNWEGLVYRVPLGGQTPDTVSLPSVADTGFKDIKDQATGCFPNQVGSITIDGAFAYVTSTCASPVGPIGVFTGKNANGVCTVLTEVADCGAGGTCNAATLKCNPNTRGVKTTTHPAVSIIDLGAATATTTVLDKLFDDAASARVPLLQSDIGFFNGFAYVSAMGTDAVFRLVVSGGAITSVGSPVNKFINLRKDANDKLIRLPVGIATAHGPDAFAFVADDGSRDVTALALGAQAIAGNPAAMDFRITQSSPLPAAGSPEEAALKGKRFFNTGLGRWSLAGAGWGSCAACHVDGLSDNVTWYFARGPRQSVSLDGTFASNDPSDQRILNWTAIFDEIADFEANTRGVSGGVGAIVSANSSPPTNADRIDTAAIVPQQQGLQGSSTDIADPAGSSAHAHSVLSDWNEIEAWIRTIRSPKKPRGLVAADVAAGKTLFGGVGQGNCVGCHGGAKWTISKRFYAPGDGPNAATNDASPSSLSNVNWNVSMNGFPQALFPANPASPTFANESRMRFGAPPGAEQIQCILRPVGTIGAVVNGVPSGVSDPEVNVLELRQDMVTGGQGAAGTGRGFNPPSLLGMQVGAPYFHAGNARTLEEVLSSLFLQHHQSAIAAVFNPDANQVKQLVAYLLSIDEDEAPFAIPAKGNTGGDLCFYP